ncbi:hypothetical protein JXD38_07330 [candidate division WOR-3 bacterium]|nr:hypothetical protein [candidate division WOR-3 bacterium]
MKKEAKLLLEKAVNGLVLSIELFNRPYDRGRTDAVLISLDHAFEMLLKAAILHRGGRIREPRAKQTIGFDTCVRKALSDGEVKFLKDEQALALQSINSLRDAAQHHLLDISEQLLYVQAQAGLTLFRDILKEVFLKDLAVDLPSRVLPLSTTPPTDLDTLFDSEVREVRRLLRPGTRHRTEAAAKLRALAIVDGAMRGERLQPSQFVLGKLGKGIVAGRTWQQLFPGVASVSMTASGYGPSLDLRLTKKKGIPVLLVPEGTPGASVIAVRRVDELGFYCMGHNQLAAKVGLSPNRLTAFIWSLDLKSDPDAHKEIAIGKSRFHRYSARAVERIKVALQEATPDEVWQEYRGRPR